MYLQTLHEAVTDGVESQATAPQRVWRSQTPRRWTVSLASGQGTRTSQDMTPSVRGKTLGKGNTNQEK